MEIIFRLIQINLRVLECRKAGVAAGFSVFTNVSFVCLNFFSQLRRQPDIAGRRHSQQQIFRFLRNRQSRDKDL